VIKGFKGFTKDLKCQGYQYEVGKAFEMDDEPILCQQGFHFCENPMDVFTYYAPGDNRYCEVEGDGATVKHGGVDGDSKVAAQKIRIGAEIGLRGMIEAGVKFVFEKSSVSRDAQTTTGYGANAATTGYGANAATTGDGANAATTGYRANASALGKQAIAAALGIESKAKAARGNWLVLSEWAQDKDWNWYIKGVQAVEVDGETIKADTHYHLVDGVVVEATHEA
jgi:hypothetical protein